jgi:hypothetical protein
MFGMLRRLSRPFLGLGRKFGEIFGLGRKLVQRERVIERGTGGLAQVGRDFVNIPMFEKNMSGDTILRGVDELGRSGGFTNRGL